MTKFSNKTKIFGIIGNPLSHTLSPVIHNFLFKEYGYDGVYLVFETANPDQTFVALQNLKVCGLSVTIPYKEWAYSISDVKDKPSEFMKASNTLTFNAGNIFANNTDGYGAIEAIKNVKENLFNSNVIILGSGGSARGISYSLLNELKGKSKIFISARNETKAIELVNLLNSIHLESTEFIPLDKVGDLKNNVSLVINTTPLGMKGQDQNILIPKDFFSKQHTLFDIVYNPYKTPLVQLAIKHKAKIIFGHEMLVYQAMKQFELFTKIQPDKKITEKVMSKVLKSLK